MVINIRIIYGVLCENGLILNTELPPRERASPNKYVSKNHTDAIVKYIATLIFVHHQQRK